MPDGHVEHMVMVTLAALNFMNCRNVELVEAQLPRAEARRVARLGERVHTINVFPVGRSTRSVRNGVGGGGIPASPVMGHFAHYGERHGRGKLFGKHEGKFWIPQHARGAKELGESKPRYRLRSGEGH
jgi:hypothetical protein